MDLRQLSKRLLFPLLKPLYRYYSTRTRSFRSHGLQVKVQPGVFHPGFFISTRLLMDFLLEQGALKGRRFLELGAGSGMVSLLAAREGARATASDLSEAAIANLKLNAQHTALPLEVVHSDLFENLSDRQFDLLFINPPYYPKAPADEAELAFYCGPEFEYFHRLFPQLHQHVAPEGEVFMILSEDCDLKTIPALARQYGWEWTTEKEIKRWGEWNYIFRLQSVAVV
ncbi:MAG: methyltransferase [Salibacteraceae bacterium]